jgi:predicted SAM-dependent methyltransferase
MKINLGSGFKRFDGFLNVDDDPLVHPDYTVNLDDVNVKLPFEDNSIEEIKAHHILEHIGDGFIPLMKEMHRVCKHGAIIDIIVPHHQHDVFYGDPTHKRPITVNIMNMFSKKFCKHHMETIGSSSGMAYKYDMDFDVIWYDFEYDQFYHPLIQSIHEKRDNGTLSDEELFIFTRLMREATNVAMNTLIKLAAVKE